MHSTRSELAKLVQLDNPETNQREVIQFCQETDDACRSTKGFLFKREKGSELIFKKILQKQILWLVITANCVQSSDS